MVFYYRYMVQLKTVLKKCTNIRYLQYTYILTTFCVLKDL